jgi:hypothetical protein
MSQHADLTTTIVSFAVKVDLDYIAARELYQDILGDCEYPEALQSHLYLRDMARYMLTQKDYLYGISHEQIRVWADKFQKSLDFPK